MRDPNAEDLQSGNLQLVVENLRFHLFSITRLLNYQSPPFALSSDGSDAGKPTTEARRKNRVSGRSGQREIGSPAHRSVAAVVSSIVPMIRCPDDPIARSSSVPLCLRGGFPRGAPVGMTAIELLFQMLAEPFPFKIFLAMTVYLLPSRPSYR